MREYCGRHRFLSALAGVVLIALAAPGAAAPADPAPTIATTPHTEGGEAAPTAEPTPSAEVCKAAVAKFGGGDRAALDGLPPAQKASLLGSEAGGRVLACLAVAENDDTFCESLPDDRKQECHLNREMLGDMKDLPKEQLKAYVMHRLCLQDGTAAECGAIEAAIRSRDASGCSAITDRSRQIFCEALATGDAAKCGALPVGTDDGNRGVCAALASDDPKRCPKDAGDCARLVGTLATMQAKGLGGLAKNEPGLAAAREGRAACAPLVGQLQAACEPQ